VTQETEPEVDVLTQLQGSGSKRGGNYHHDEDIQLCRSWSNITTDPITANDTPYAGELRRRRPRARNRWRRKERERNESTRKRTGGRWRMTGGA